jgi:hypothetical protein
MMVTANAEASLGIVIMFRYVILRKKISTQVDATKALSPSSGEKVG